MILLRFKARTSCSLESSQLVLKIFVCRGIRDFLGAECDCFPSPFTIQNKEGNNGGLRNYKTSHVEKTSSFILM